MQFKNMKIEINDQQPLDEVVSELKKNGYVNRFKTSSHINTVVTFSDGLYCCYAMRHTQKYIDMPLTTLTELKEMK